MKRLITASLMVTLGIIPIFASSNSRSEGILDRANQNLIRIENLGNLPDAHMLRESLLELINYGPMKAVPEDQQIPLNIVTSSYGEVAGLLADNQEANVIYVSGPIDSDDITALRDFAAAHELELLDLGEAQIQNNAIPFQAFYDTAQDIPYNEGPRPRIRQIILPEGLVSIGVQAFKKIYCQQINIPSTVTEIGSDAFCDNSELDCQLTIPEGIQTLPNGIFSNCVSLSFAPGLPHSLKRIGNGAFFNCFSLCDIELPSDLEAIEDLAFRATAISSLTIPENCLELGECALGYMADLTEITLPENLTSLPKELLTGASSLKQFTCPPSCSVIEESALSMLYDLEGIVFNEGLETIGWSALYMAGMNREEGLQTICLPSTLKYIRGKALWYVGLKSVYCKATIAPEYEDDPVYGSSTPYQEVFTKPDVAGATLYVPIGCSESYRGSQIWKYFTNIVETDEFPNPSVKVESIYGNRDEAPLYDLMGRKVTAPQAGSIYIRNGKKVIF